MYLESLSAKYVRNLSDISLEPTPGLNILIGRNASGKTALLEAIYFLSRARSFRTSRIKDAIQYDQESLQVRARLLPANSPAVTTGIEKGSRKSIIRYNGETVRVVSEQARRFPLILITPDSHYLITGTPKQRRHWLDWAMFHVEPDYLVWWRDYHKALRQRNTLLRLGKGGSEMEGWERLMVKAAHKIQKSREEFVVSLSLRLQTLLKGGILQIPQVHLLKGWADEAELEELYLEAREDDRRAGYTRYGPHKADLGFFVEDRAIDAVCSRGQIKLYVNALLVAQAQVYESYSNEKPVFLVDDFAAELDKDSQRSLLILLKEQAAQVFLTATALEYQYQYDADMGMTMFHVERGNISKVVK